MKKEETKKKKRKKEKGGQGRGGGRAGEETPDHRLQIILEKMKRQEKIN